MREAEAELEAERARVASAEAEADFARHAYEELSKLAVEPGEEEALASRRQSMMQSEKVFADIRDARDHLAGDAAAMPVLLSVSRRLQRRLPQAPEIIEPSVKALDEAIEALENATRAVEAAIEACAVDPHELERCEERLFALRAMSRKYAAPIDALPALAEKYGGDLAALDAGRGEVARLEAEVSRDQAAYAKAASALSAARALSASELEKAVAEELSPLKLERAEFRVEIEGRQVANFGQRLRSGRIFGPHESGVTPGTADEGRLRGRAFPLSARRKGSAFRAQHGAHACVRRDRHGRGGAVADAMGQRLARLGMRAQVLAVTHAPQVAARAHNHYRITKNAVGKGERVATSVHRLDAGERREEVARMLAGAEITHEARAAAISLIDRAG